MLEQCKDEAEAVQGVSSSLVQRNDRRKRGGGGGLDAKYQRHYNQILCRLVDFEAQKPTACEVIRKRLTDFCLYVALAWLLFPTLTNAHSSGITVASRRMSIAWPSNLRRSPNSRMSSVRMGSPRTLFTTKTAMNEVARSPDIKSYSRSFYLERIHSF